MKIIFLFFIILFSFNNFVYGKTTCPNSPMIIREAKDLEYVEKNWDKCFGAVTALTSPASSEIEGEFFKGEINFGTWTRYKGGSAEIKYVGELKDWNFNGKGVVTYKISDSKKKSITHTPNFTKNVKVYSTFKNQKIDRKKESIVIIQDELIYIGQLNPKMDKHGEGVEIKKDGSIYNGRWRYSKKDGRGVQFNSDGSIVSGLWRSDKLVEEDDTIKKKINISKMDFSNLSKDIDDIRRIYHEGGLTEEEYNDIKNILLN